MPKLLTVEEYFRKMGFMSSREALERRLKFIDAGEIIDSRKGKDGNDGRDGRDGSVGPQGPAGASGKDGLGFKWRGHWLESETYQTYDVVNYLGSTYVALSPTRGSYPNRINNEWDLMAAAGAQGANGRDGTDLRDTPHVGVPTFIQDDEPDYTEGPYVWVQTGLGPDGCQHTVWYKTC